MRRWPIQHLGFRLAVYAEGGILPDTKKSLVWVDEQGKAVAITPFKAPSSRLGSLLMASGPPTQPLEEKNQVWVYDLNRA